MKRFQKINRFIGTTEICRKDLLAKNLNRMRKSFPDDYDFFPKTWCLPGDYTDALYYNKLHKNKTFILKPESGSRGRGIFLTKNLSDVAKSEKNICQVYVSKPYLIEGFKFDIRVYALLASCDPLRIYVYNEGLARFATEKYANPSTLNCLNIFMHLTNYSVNKRNTTYTCNQYSGSKRKISTLNRILETRGVNVQQLWKNIDQAIVKTVISAWPVLKHNYHACFSSHDMMHACFEILGFDILLDQNANPFVLEVNHSPSLQTDTLLDKEVKESLLADTLTLLNIWQCDKRKILEEDRKRIKERLTQKNLKNFIDPISEEKENCKERNKFLDEQIEWENSHLGNYRCVYPDGDEYAKFFEQPSGTLYLSTMSSRARGECVKQQRIEIEAKAKLKLLNKLPSISDRSKNIYEESKDKNSKIKDTAKLKKETFGKKSILPNIVKSEHFYAPDEPIPILESEERKRLFRLAHRSALLESHGISGKVYNLMKQIGTLKPEEEEKFNNHTCSDQTKLNYHTEPT